VIEWGYADTEEAIIDLGRLLKDRDAFEALVTGGGGIDLVEDEEWSENPIANAIYDHLRSQFCLDPEDAAELAGATLQILKDAGPYAVLAALSTNEAG
jgi:hypothetical protein